MVSACNTFNQTLREGKKQQQKECEDKKSSN
jgi:hypothetical protein